MSGVGTCTPATNRMMMEYDMVEKYHWLPQDIKKIPYKDLQMLSLISRQKHRAIEERSKPKSDIAPKDRPVNSNDLKALQSKKQKETKK
jgi:hypothetical protein